MTTATFLIDGKEYYLVSLYQKRDGRENGWTDCSKFAYEAAKLAPRFEAREVFQWVTECPAPQRTEPGWCRGCNPDNCPGCQILDKFKKKDV